MNENWRSIWDETVKKSLNSYWEFHRLDSNQENSKSKVEVNNELINDVDANFINIISDFYFVESLNKIELSEDRELKISNLRKVSEYYSHLLRLKLFYQEEIKKCFEYLYKTKFNLKDYFLYIPIFEDLSSVLRFLIEKSEDNDDDYAFERIILLDFIFNDLLFRDYFSPPYWWQDRYWDEVYSLNSESENISNEDLIKRILQRILGNIGNVLNFFNKELKKCETEYFLLNINELDIFGRRHRISSFGELFHQEVLKADLAKFAYEKVNCYSTMAIGEEIFISLNGIKDKEISIGSNLAKVVAILQKLLPRKSSYVGISDNTRYYYQDNYGFYDNITYKQYEETNSKESYNRMFTCCERKLIAHLDSLGVQLGSKIELTTTKFPCQLCKRAIDNVNNGKIFTIDIRSSSYKLSLTEEHIYKYDSYAKKIKISLNSEAEN